MARPSLKNIAEKTPKQVAEDISLTPLMRQYYAAKAQYPDAILLFRIGDFYETFGEDAVTASKVLGIVLTNRNNGSADTELAGFPHHSLDVYLPKFVRAGFRVAICEQMEKPVPGRVVRRQVTEVITPGVTVDDKILDRSRNNFLAAVTVQRDNFGLAFLDISTGEFLITEGSGFEYLDKVFQTFQPSEVLFSKSQKAYFQEKLGERYYTYTLDEWIFQEDYGRQKVLEHFQTPSLKGFGIEDMNLAQTAAGVILHYLAATENKNLQHIASISRLQNDRYVWLDRFTMRNLELLAPNHENGKSLIDILDQTRSPMGARLLKKWIGLPLKNLIEIDSRLNSVSYFVDNETIRWNLEAQIRQMGDLERLVSKVPLAKINPREVRSLAHSLKIAADIPAILNDTPLGKLVERIDPCATLRQRIEQTLRPEPPVSIAKGGAIADGAHPDLDELRDIVKNAQQILLDLQQREIEKTGIQSLKVGFNNVFGYYLEVTARYKNIEIPENWVRKQTLANAERYITPELKVLEEKILGAEEKIQALEAYLFQNLTTEISEFIEPIQRNAQIVATIDCLRSFAEVAQKNNFTRPLLNNSNGLEIEQGRHPVIEQMLPLGESYVPNDVVLHPENQQILMITGPNMAGKSALLRQTALIALMAQMGSFVPARQARLGLLDKVFTRVGASDNISAGESTFMVEMNETASIMNNLSERSLVLLDEIGRGTSTYDGISIAWSIAEFLHDHEMTPKTLFATHYHELNELAEKHPRIKNFHVATREVGQKVIFLRKLEEGGSEHSFGVHVAKMAGMPASIVQRAHVILAQLEQKHIEIEENTQLTTKEQTRQKVKAIKNLPTQFNIFDAGDPRLHKLKEALDALDLNATTPIELMMKVLEWKKMLEDV
jgi:DNA mismatch repair protein MutS